MQTVQEQLLSILLNSKKSEELTLNLVGPQQTDLLFFYNKDTKKVETATKQVFTNAASYPFVTIGLDRIIKGTGNTNLSQIQVGDEAMWKTMPDFEVLQGFIYDNNVGDGNPENIDNWIANSSIITP